MIVEPSATVLPSMTMFEDRSGSAVNEPTTIGTAVVEMDFVDPDVTTLRLVAGELPSVASAADADLDVKAGSKTLRAFEAFGRADSAVVVGFSDSI